MISITDIRYGWAVLNIGYCSFDVSYLTNLVGEIDWLLNLDEQNDEIECKKSYFEGEGQGDLTLVSYLTYGNIDDWCDKSDYIINIVWQRLYCGSPEGESYTILKFSYKKFKEEWLKLKENIKEDYIKNFVCPQTKEEYEEALAEY